MDCAWGYVIDVPDGDTFKIDITSQKRGNEYHYEDLERVRLRDRNAPEISAPGGIAAQRRLASQIAGRRVRIDIYGRDKYGRLVAEVDPNP